MTWYAALLGAAGNQQNQGGSNNTGLVGNTLGISAGLDARDKNRDRRAMQEFERQAKNEQMYNYGEAKRANERAQDLTGEFTGQLGTDYVTGSMIGPTDRASIGGAALEQVLNSAGGYNPVVANNPYMGVLSGDQAAMQAIEDSARANTERTLSDWEGQQRQVVHDYERAAQQLANERDTMRQSYADRLTEDRESANTDMAETIVQAWIDSDSVAGANHDPRFIHNRREGRGKYGRGKAIGAKEQEKAKWVQELLDSGMSYEDLLTDPDFLEYLKADPNSSRLLGEYEV